MPASIDETMKAINRNTALRLYCTKVGKYAWYVRCNECVTGKEPAYKINSKMLAWLEKIKLELIGTGYDYRNGANPFTDTNFTNFLKRT